MIILVVEDHPAESKLAHGVLTAAGHSVTVVHEAEFAFSVIEKNRPDVILIDIALPGMNGLELTLELRSKAMTAGFAVVAMTTFPERYTRGRALLAGCDEYLIKPLNTRSLPTQLLDTVNKKAKAAAMSQFH